MVRLLLPCTPGRHCQDPGPESCGHVHVCPEHDSGGLEAAMVEANHSQSGGVLPLRSTIHGPSFLPRGTTGNINISTQFIPAQHDFFSHFFIYLETRLEIRKFVAILGAIYNPANLCF